MPLMSVAAFSIAMLEFGVLGYIWFIAYLNPNKSVTVFINRLGEMNFELILIPIVLAFCLVCLAYQWKQYFEEAA